MDTNGLSGLWGLLTEFANSDAGKWLPVSPFQRFVAGWEGIPVIQQYLKYINWFIPISTLLDIMLVWLAAIGVFYAVMAILRWIRVVGD